MYKKNVILKLAVGVAIFCLMNVSGAFAAPADDYFREGNDYRANREFDKAIEMYGKVIEIYPDAFEAYTNIGFCYYSLKDYDQAISNFTKATELNPMNYMALEGLGGAYLDLGQYEKSIEYNLRALEVNSSSPSAYYGLGLAYGLNGQYKEAIESLEQARDLYQEAGDELNLEVIEGFLAELEESRSFFEANDGRDGSSIEKAVVIKFTGDYQESIGQEYEYIAYIYGTEGADYEVLGQALQGEGESSYDVISIKLIPSGEEKAVYFDVTDLMNQWQ